MTYSNGYSIILTIMLLLPNFILNLPEIDSCANGNPCDAAFCAKFPSANCRPSAEDPCKAEFFYKNRKVIKECFNGEIPPFSSLQC